MPRLKSFKYDALAQIAYDAWSRDRPEAISVDTETDGFAWNCRPFGVTVAWEGEAHYIEMGDFIREVQVATMLSETPTLILHNAKFDFRMLILQGVLTRKRLTWEMFNDTETIAHLLDHDRPKSLKKLAQIVLNQTTDEDETLKVVRRKLKMTKDDGYDLLPREVLIPYAITDARFTYDLWEALHPQLESKENLASLYVQERKLTLALLDMEFAGLAVREDYVEETVKDYGLRILKLEREIQEMVGIEGFNPASPKQITEAFEARGITLESTAVATLETIDDPLGKLILELRKYSKLRQTYLIPMQQETFDGILHPSLRQHGSRTGRMSSGAASNN